MSGLLIQSRTDGPDALPGHRLGPWWNGGLDRLEPTGQSWNVQRRSELRSLIQFVAVILELADQLLQLGRHSAQFAGCLQTVVGPWDVLCAAVATAVMFWAISPDPLAASPTLRPISLAVAVCSSTALAMVLLMSLI